MFEFCDLELVSLGWDWESDKYAKARWAVYIHNFLPYNGLKLIKL